MSVDESIVSMIRANLKLRFLNLNSPIGGGYIELLFGDEVISGVEIPLPRQNNTYKICNE
jgi:hypothetical protein